jgi:hypothetical protein
MTNLYVRGPAWPDRTKRSVNVMSDDAPALNEEINAIMEKIIKTGN